MDKFRANSSKKGYSEIFVSDIKMSIYFKKKKKNVYNPRD